jgi:TadE-like protein
MSRSSRAQSLVELALIAPIVILLAMSVWDGGSVLREQVVLQQAARDGARAAAIAYGGASLTVVQDAVLASAAAELPGLPNTPGYLSVNYNSPDPQSVQVRLQYAHMLVTPVLRQLWGSSQGTVMLSASATFYLPQLTQVPATIVPSTPIPTATPTPTLTPTPTVTPSPTATATPTPPGPCIRPFTFPSMAATTGYSVTLHLTATSDITAVWFSDSGEASSLSITLYRGATSVLATSGTGAAFLTAVGETMGTYTLVFSTADGLTRPSTVIIGYQSGNCS